MVSNSITSSTGTGGLLESKDLYKLFDKDSVKETNINGQTISAYKSGNKYCVSSIRSDYKVLMSFAPPKPEVHEFMTATEANYYLKSLGILDNSILFETNDSNNVSIYSKDESHGLLAKLEKTESSIFG